MDQSEDMDAVSAVLSSFECSQDADIEYFLRSKAIEFEQLGKSRTYLVCDEEQLTGDDEGPLAIYGYFALALKILTVPQGTSNRVRKELDGMSAKIHGEVINDFPCYLIGQLARASSVPPEILPGSVLIDLACDVIAQAVQAVGGRYIMIECHDDSRLVRFYEKNRFSEISRIPDEAHPMVQMIRKI